MLKRASVLLFIFIYLAAMVVHAPAALLDKMLRQESRDRLTLANAEGTLWNGEAQLSLRQHDGTLTVLEPLHWNLSAADLLTGKIHARLGIDAQSAATDPTELLATLHGVELRHAHFQLPAEALDETSPMLKLARFRGHLEVRSDHLRMTPDGIEGAATIDWLQASSGLSHVAPLGDYRLTLNATGASIGITLATLDGVLLLDGQGDWQNGRGLNLQINARAAPGSEDSLSELLYNLGPQTAPGVHSLNIVPQ